MRDEAAAKMKNVDFDGSSEKERRARRRGEASHDLNTERQSGPDLAGEASTVLGVPEDRSTRDDGPPHSPYLGNDPKPRSVTGTRRKRREKEGDASVSPQVLPLLPRLSAFWEPEEARGSEEKFENTAEEFVAASPAAAESAQLQHNASPKQQEGKTLETDSRGYHGSAPRTEAPSMGSLSAPSPFTPHTSSVENVSSFPSQHGRHTSAGAAKGHMRHSAAGAVHQQQQENQGLQKGEGTTRVPQFSPALLTGFSEPLPAFPEILPAGGKPSGGGGDDHHRRKTIIFDSELRGLLLTALYDVLLFVFVLLCWLRLRRFRGDYVCGAYEKKIATRDAGRIAVAAAAAIATTREDAVIRAGQRTAGTDGDGAADSALHHPVDVGNVASAGVSGGDAAAATAGFGSAAAAVERAKHAAEMSAAAAAELRNIAVAAAAGESEGDEKVKRAAVGAAAAEAAAQQGDEAAAAAHEAALAAIEGGGLGGEAVEAAHGRSQEEGRRAASRPSGLFCCYRRPACGSWKKKCLPVTTMWRAVAREVSGGGETLTQVCKYLNTPLALAHTQSCTGKGRGRVKRRRFWRMHATRMTAAAGGAATRATAAARAAATAAQEAAAGTSVGISTRVGGAAGVSAGTQRGASQWVDAGGEAAKKNGLLRQPEEERSSSWESSWRGVTRQRRKVKEWEKEQQEQGTGGKKEQRLSDEEGLETQGEEKMKKGEEALRAAGGEDGDAGPSPQLRGGLFSLSAVSTVAPQRSDLTTQQGTQVKGGAGGRGAAAAGVAEAAEGGMKRMHEDEISGGGKERGGGEMAVDRRKQRRDQQEEGQEEQGRRRAGETRSFAKMMMKQRRMEEGETQEKEKTTKRWTPSSEELRMAAAWAMADIDIESLRGDMACYFHFLNTLVWCCKAMMLGGLLLLTPVYLATPAQPSDDREFLTFLDMFSAADKTAPHALWLMFAACWIFSGVVYYAVYALWHHLDEVRTRPAVLLALLRTSHSLHALRAAAAPPPEAAGAGAVSRPHAPGGRREDAVLQMVVGGSSRRGPTSGGGPTQRHQAGAAASSSSSSVSAAGSPASSAVPFAAAARGAAAAPAAAAVESEMKERGAGRRRDRGRAAKREGSRGLYRPSTSNRLKMYQPMDDADAGDEAAAGVSEALAAAATTTEGRRADDSSSSSSTAAADDDSAEEEEERGSEDSQEEQEEEGEEDEKTTALTATPCAAGDPSSAAAAALPSRSRAGQEKPEGSGESLAAPAAAALAASAGGRPGAAFLPLARADTREFAAAMYERLLDADEAQVMAPPQYYSVILSHLDRRIVSRQEFAEAFVDIHERYCSVCCPASSNWRGVLLRQLRAATAAAEEAATTDGTLQGGRSRMATASTTQPSARGSDAEGRSSSSLTSTKTVAAAGAAPAAAAVGPTRAVSAAAVEGRLGGSSVWGGGHRHREPFGAAADSGSPQLLLRRSSSASSRLLSEAGGSRSAAAGIPTTQQQQRRESRAAAGAGGGAAAEAHTPRSSGRFARGGGAAAAAAANEEEGETEQQLFLSGGEECETKLARRHTAAEAVAAAGEASTSSSCCSNSFGSLCVPGSLPDSHCTCVLNVLLILHASKNTCLYGEVSGQQQLQNGDQGGRGGLLRSEEQRVSSRMSAVPHRGAASAAAQFAVADAASPTSSTRLLVSGPSPPTAAAAADDSGVGETDAAAQEKQQNEEGPQQQQQHRENGEAAADAQDRNAQRHRCLPLVRRHGADAAASHEGSKGVLPSRNSGVAIVTFDNRVCVEEILRHAYRYRSVSSKYLDTEGPMSAHGAFTRVAVAPAAPPADIQWDNLHLSGWNRGLRLVLLNAVLVALCLTVISPVVLLSELSPIMGSIDAQWREHRIGFLTLTAWLPPLILLVVNSYMQPLLVAYVAYGAGFWLKSQEAAYIVHGNIAFQLLNTLILPLLSLSSIESVLRVMYTSELTTWSVLLGYSLVHSSGGFAMRYLVNLSFLGAANELLQLYSIVAAKVDAYFFHVKERRRYPFDLGYAYAQTLSVFTLLLLFSVVVPLLLPLGLLYLYIRGLVDRYNYAYHVHTLLPFESDGWLVTIAMKYMLFAVSFLQFAMAGFFCAQKQSTALVIAGSFMLFLSLVSWISLCFFTIPAPGSAAGREAAWQRELHARDVQIFLPRQRRQLSDAYRQPCGKAAKCDCCKY